MKVLEMTLQEFANLIFGGVVSHSLVLILNAVTYS
jgi:hypothetical protein